MPENLVSQSVEPTPTPEPGTVAASESAPPPPSSSSEQATTSELPPEPPRLGSAERAQLLDLTRLALRCATGQLPVRFLEEALECAGSIDIPGAVFVTLTEFGDLRGCMGSLDRDMALPESVASAALTVARHDPRFLPIRASELPAIHVEISVLGDAIPLGRPDDFRPGVDGVIVDRGGRRALLLPEVATDQGWGATEMFDTVCRKAGLPRDAWRDPETRVLRFCTVRFGGPAVERPHD